MFRKNQQVHTILPDFPDHPFNGKLAVVIEYDIRFDEYRVEMKEDALPNWIEGDPVWVLPNQIEEICSN